MAEALDFTEAAKGKLAIVTTEAATNLLKHAGGGQIILRNQAGSIEVFAVDAGPGIASITDSARDGFSTAGSLGVGLGAMQRMASDFEIYSIPGHGTVLRALCSSGIQAASPLTYSIWDVSAFILPLAGEEACGDCAEVRDSGSVIQILLADGLGHGILASDAAERARAVFLESHGDPQSLIETIHTALRSTRGAAVAIAEIDTNRNRVRFCGVGNIAGSIVHATERSQHMVSMNGIVGHQVIRPRQFEYQWNAASVLLMHSDGIGSRWQLSSYPGLLNHRSSMIAASLFRDFRKTTDDATMLAGKQK